MTVLDARPDQRWLFCFAHPDDELAVAGWMHHLVKSGAFVACAWAHCSAIRRAESEAASALIGVSHLLFGEMPDGNFVDHLPELRQWVSQASSSFAPDRVVTTAFEQGHLDHDGLNYAVNQVGGRPILEFPMYWHYARVWQRINRFANPDGEQIWPLDTEATELKKRVLDCFRSQSAARNVAIYERLVPPELRLFQTERLRLQPPTDFSQTVHAGGIGQKIMRSRRWRRWMQAMRTEGRLP